jgi:hypothetical protein
MSGKELVDRELARGNIVPEENLPQWHFGYHKSLGIEHGSPRQKVND